MNEKKTEYVEFTGKAYWAKVYIPDTSFGASNYKIDLVLDGDNEWAKFKASGIQKKTKDTENGKSVQFTRPAMKVINNEVVNFTGPIVLDDAGGVIVDYISKDTNKRAFSYKTEEKNKIERRGSPILIGNGSTVKVRVAVYDTQKGKGQRLENITILDLIEYKTSGELPKLSKLVSEKVDDNPENEEIEIDSNEKPW